MKLTVLVICCTAIHERLILVTTVGIYCPISKGIIYPTVQAVGREGLWRLQQGDYGAPSDVVQKALEDDFQLCLQAEELGFFLVELQIGNK